MPDSSEVIKNIVHYQKSLNRYSQKGDDAKILHYIGKLYSMPVTVSHLEETGIGRTVNSLRKLGGHVEDAAKTLVRKWKQMVSGNNESDEAESKVQDSRRGSESNSSQRRSDKHRSSDRNDKPNKDEKYNHSRRDKDNGHRSSSEAKYKPVVSSTSEDDENGSVCQSEVEEEDDGESGVASESPRSSSSEEDNHHSEPISRSYDKHSENSAKYNKRDSERHHTSRERSDSKDRPKRNEAQTENDRKKHKHSSSSESANKHSSKKRKHDSSSSEEESRKKIPKTSQDTHKSSSHRSRDSTSDSHRSSSHKHKESSSSSSHSSKKDSRSDADKRDSKSSSRSDKKDKESSKDERSKSKRESSDKKSKEKDKSKSKSSSKSSSGSSSNGNHKKMVDICSESGTSFAEALGMLEPSTSRISTSSTANSVSNKKPKCSEPTNHKSERSERPPKEKSSTTKTAKSDKMDIVIPPPPKENLDINIASLLPSITPNYRPIANPHLDNNHRGKVMNDDEALSLVMSQKNLRTKVFSGNKSYFGTVPSLFELCIRVLQDNIDALEYTGGVPYSILKPILDKATPDQLFMLEHHNPYLIEDSDEIWMYHCQKEFRSKRREEMESWREMYMRCLDEREAKLKALTENIKLAQDKSTPVRQTKLAYVDSVVKPPRDVIRKQVKSGFAEKKPAVTPSSRLASIAASGAAAHVSVPNPVRASSSSGHTSAAAKPKKAPLMQKTLQFLKGNRFRR